MARSASELPSAPAGAMWMEPKWDGFRATIVRDGQTTSLWSRQRKELTAGFPEIIAAAAASIPSGCVVDGELVVWSNDRLDFDALQRRSASGPKRALRLAEEIPASYVAFDLLAVVERDIRFHPLSTRGALLEELASSWAPPLSLSPGTLDRTAALEWFDSMVSARTEGVIVKAIDGVYAAGSRESVKVKRRDTIDVIVGAVIGSIRQPESVAVGLPIEGALRIAERSTPLRPAAARALSPLLRYPTGRYPWPIKVQPGSVIRFAADRQPVELTLVEPMVAEISTDTARSGHAFRHGVRFIRPRPEFDAHVVLGTWSVPPSS